jgi:hypothetical protein
MECLFVYTSKFDRRLRELKDWPKIQENLESTLLGDPEIGDLIQGTHGLRKFRFAYGDKGKSGGLRILYFDLIVVKRIYMVALFTKNEKENLSKEELNLIGMEILKIKSATEKRRT